MEVVPLLQSGSKLVAPENSMRKLMKQDFSYNSNLLPGSSVVIGFGAVSTLI